MDALRVALNDVDVGILERFEDERQLFSFAESYRTAFLNQRPVLGQIFEDRFPRPLQVDGPIGWFTNLLPQGAMLQWRSRLHGIDIDDSFSLLSILGSDLPGSVTLEPTSPTTPGARTRSSKPSQAIDRSDGKLRFSLAGAQWKLSARTTDRGLTTQATEGHGHFIAKFHSPEFPGLPQLEFATMNWAKAAGIDTCDFEVRSASEFETLPEELPVGDGTVYVCRRFDRAVEHRIHIEDFAQILDRPPGDAQYKGNYEHIARVLRWLAPKDSIKFLKLMIFNLLAGNGDAHLKNFSIRYPDGRKVEFAPAYDLVSTIVYYPPEKEQLALKLQNSNQFYPACGDRLLQLARESGLASDIATSLIKAAIASVFDTWGSKSVSEHYSTEQRRKIQLHLDRMRRELRSDPNVFPN